MERCLELAEFILRDPKYRKTVENSHNVLADFLNLMEKAQKVESKVILVKILVSKTHNIIFNFSSQDALLRNNQLKSRVF